MLFVKNEDLRVGMRLARPIYNKNGVLLYERDSKLTPQGIASVSNFGLFGVFILEPAEPCPPMSQDDLEFERFQTMYSFSIREEMNRIVTSGKASKIDTIAANIIRCYGHYNHPINFVQGLRSKEDYIYKHCLNVAILSALITNKLNVRVDEQNDTIMAALLHDIGKLMAPKSILDKTEWTQQDRDAVEVSVTQGFLTLENVFASNLNIKRTAFQAHRAATEYKLNKKVETKMTLAARILAVANAYDNMTSMQFDADPKSEVEALRILKGAPELYDKVVVEALLQVINILSPGTCIELNTGEKGLIIAKNDDILRPMILCFGNNQLMDLSNDLYSDLTIKDIMKTMDNRHIMDMDALNNTANK